MITVELDRATHDWKVTNGALSLIDGRDADRQGLDTSLRWFFGEWFLDPAGGVPHFQRILVRNVNEGDVIALLRDYILNTPYAQVVRELDVLLDTLLRTADINGEVIDSTGDLTAIATTIGV